MGSEDLSLLAVGDLIVDTTPPADWLFETVAPVFRAATVVVGQGEVPFTKRGIDTFVDFFCSSTPCDPGNIPALASAGFGVITLATNHIWDAGAPGVADTLQGLAEVGIATVGAGMNIEEARKPVVLEREGTRFGFLAYNCTGPVGSWATSFKAGCSYVHVVAAYEVGVPVVGGYPTVYSFAEPNSLNQMADDVRRLRPHCDVLAVSLHKGIGFVPAILAGYEQQVAYAAIDAGADLVLGHHAHILKGIEFYKGKPIFHGLGNFVVVTELDGKTYFRYGVHKRARDKRITSPEAQEAYMLEFIRRNGGPFFFGPRGQAVPFPPKEVNLTIIAKCTVENRQVTRVSYLPCVINEHGQPEIMGNDEKGAEVFEYMHNISVGIGLNVKYQWEDNEVLVLPKS